MITRLAILIVAGIGTALNIRLNLSRFVILFVYLCGILGCALVIDGMKIYTLHPVTILQNILPKNPQKSMKRKGEFRACQFFAYICTMYKAPWHCNGLICISNQ